MSLRGLVAGVVAFLVGAGSLAGALYFASRRWHE